MNRAELGRQGVWYLVAGASAALLELVLFQLLYVVAGRTILESNVFATIVATAYNFVVNRNVAFKSAVNPLRSAALYTLLFVINMGISTAAIGFLVSVGVDSAVSKLAMQACVMLWNFVLYRKVVFL